MKDELQKGKSILLLWKWIPEVWNTISGDGITSGFKNDCAVKLGGAQRDSTFGKIVEKPKEISSDGTLTDSQDTRDTFESNCFMKCQLLLLSCFSRVQLFAIPWTVAHQAPLSMGFSWQEYWRGLPFIPPGDLPDPGVRGSTLIETFHPGQAP